MSAPEPARAAVAREGARHGLQRLPVHTPFVIRWPGRLPARITRRTSHNELVPTLLTELFGCANPPCDYASGWDQSPPRGALRAAMHETIGFHR